MLNRAMSESEIALHISEQVVGFKVPDTSTVDHSFHGFTDATSQCSRIVLNIPVSLSHSNAINIQVTLGWFTFKPLKGPVTLLDYILKCIIVY